MKKMTLAIAVLSVFTSVATLFAHEHKIMGTVTSVAADHLVMKTTDNKDATITVNPTTKITKGKAAVSLQGIKPGTRVVVTTASDETPYMAMSIQVGTAKPSAPKNPTSHK